MRGISTGLEHMSSRLLSSVTNLEGLDLYTFPISGVIGVEIHFCNTSTNTPPFAYQTPELSEG